MRRIDLRAGEVSPDDLAAELRQETDGPGHEARVLKVREIIDRVRSDGDRALYELTAEFDGCDLSATGLEVPEAEIAAARDQISFDLFEALEEAAGRIEAFQRHLLGAIPVKTNFERSGEYVDDLMRVVRSAGLYAPGGRFAYPSTVLMTGIPARIAGVKNVVTCVPPGPDGNLPAATLVAAGLAGIDRLFKVGGAQAIGAMAYGTESIPAVDVVAGPGNAYVAIAKREVFGQVGIDAVAGPSELMVIADRDADPSWVAIDVLAQVEHGPGGSIVVAVFDEGVAEQIIAAIDAEIARDGRAELSEAIASGGSIVTCSHVEQALELANAFAPEHLQLMVEDPGSLLGSVETAGAVFLGYATSATYGDYVAGPNHVLPTGGAARYASALSVEHFVRRMHAVQFPPKAIETVGLAAETISEAEGLKAHAESVRRRRIWLESQP